TISNGLLSRSLHNLFALNCSHLIDFYNVLSGQKRFSGHNKWSKIKHTKGVKDIERGNLFAKLTKEIQLSIRIGGSTDPSMNLRLAAALAQAKKACLPKDNVENAFKRALGQGKDGNNVENVTYEGYGPGGVAFIIDTLTDNKNRTVKEVKSLFTKSGGSMSNVSWMFEKKGTIQFNSSNTQDNLDRMMDNAIEIFGVEDIQELEDNVLEVTSMSSGYIPTSTIQIDNDDKELIDKLNKFIKSLNDHEDVVGFHNNAE
ncbi:13735_t:CDS:2, partial [Cetraspora pellucida]